MTDPYGVEPEPNVPDLPGDPVVHETAEHVLDALASELYVHARICVRTFGDFHFALSVGPFQERLIRRLMIDPNVRGLPWNRTHVWAITDHPDEAGRSAFRSITGLLVDQAGIPEANLHVPDHTTGGAADAYEARLQQTLAWREKGQDRLDAALLVVEADGSLAGVRPDDSRVASADRLVVEAAKGLSMTTRLINATRLITVVATGPEAGGRLREIDTGRPTMFPSPIGGQLRWHLDLDACPA